MSSVMFDVGSSFAKKRKRMKGTNAHKKVEVKQWNPRYLGDGATFDSINLYNICATGNDSPVAGSSWMPFEIHMPSNGSNSYQRVGNSIFLKYLRFKGYVRVYNKAVHGIRWRLRLIRTDNFEFTSASGDGLNAIKRYLNSFKASQYPTDNADWSTPSAVANMCRHNFYKCYKDIDNNNVLQSKVIASGYIPVSSPATTGVSTGTIVGSETSTVALNTNTINITFNEGFYNMPLDDKVKCIDTVKVGDIRYYYVLETDYGVGTIYSNTNSLAMGLTIASAIVEVNFFIRGYFTDL